MQSNLDKYKSDLEALIERGVGLFYAIQFECLSDDQIDAALKEQKIAGKKLSEFKAKIPSFKDKYQGWYSECYAVIKQLLPDRLNDFVKHYEKPKGRKEITYENYTIEDYLQGLHVTRGYIKEKVVGPDAAIPQFRQQLGILKSVQRKFESSLFEIKQLVQADLFDSELEAARELLRNKFKRPAGAVAGVVLEKHLHQICENHKLAPKKENPAIGDLNDLLKENEVTEVPQWRFIQHLSDLRNLCDHYKKDEPTEEQVKDLIDGVEKVIKTLF